MALSTSLAARSVRGLKLCFSRSANSSGDCVSVAPAAPAASASVLMVQTPIESYALPLSSAAASAASRFSFSAFIRSGSFRSCFSLSSAATLPSM